MADIEQLTLEKGSVNCPGVSRTETEHIRLDSTVITLWQLRYLEKYEVNRYKAIKSGNLVVLYCYEFPLLLNHHNTHNTRSVRVRTEEYQNRNALKANFEIKRLIHANFKPYAKFISLTFANTDKFNINSLVDCDKYRINFINRLKYKFGNLIKYILAIEFQKRGAVHYHLICNIDYLPKKELAELWLHGFSDIRAIKDLDVQARYIAKYVKKNRKDERFKGKRTYITSNNLEKPKTVYGKEALKLKDQITDLKLKPIYHNKFISVLNGVAQFAEFILPEGS